VLKQKKQKSGMLDGTVCICMTDRTQGNGCR